MSGSRRNNTRKPWALRIRGVRKLMGLNQTDFSELLGTKQSNVSNWENGNYRPAPDAFTRLAAIAPDSEKLYFLELAGLPSELVDGTDAPMLTGALLDQMRRLELLRPNCAQIGRGLGVSARHVRRVYLGRVTNLHVKKAIEAHIRKRYRQTQAQERVG